MERLNRLLSRFLPLFLLSYILSVSIRFIQAYGSKDSFWHVNDGKFVPILSPDASLYGYNAKQLLEGGQCVYNECSFIEYFIYIPVKYLGVNIDSVMYFAPAFLAPLVLLPIMLIFSLYGFQKIGAIAGIFGALGYGYYSRTYLGYLDSDTLIIFFLLLALYGVIASFEKRNPIYLVISAFSLYGLYGWYHSALPLIVGFVGWSLFCAILLFVVKYKKYVAAAVLFFTVAISGYFAIQKGYVDTKRLTSYMERYVKRDALSHLETKSGEYNFLKTMEWVAESRPMSAEEAMKNLSGGSWIFVASLVAFGFVVYKFPSFLFTFGVAGFGILTFLSGMRFSIFAEAILLMAIFLALALKLRELEQLKFKAIALALVVIPVAFLVGKNLHYWNTKVAVPTFVAPQVKVLEKLSQIVKPSDYMFTWWDYGWTLWYYTGMKTLIDNGNHHEDNFVVSEALMSDDPKYTANLIEYFTANPSLRWVLEKEGATVFERLKKGEFQNIGDFDRFVIIPFQMIDLLLTINNFSNIDIKTGESKGLKLIFIFEPQGEDDRFVQLSEGVVFDKHQGIIHQNNTAFKIKRAVKIKDEIINGEYKKSIEEQPGHSEGLNLIVYKKKFYFMDDHFYNSFATQAFFFDKVDERYFEKVYVDMFTKLYRVK